MSLWKIAWRSIEQRTLSSALTGLALALGVTLVVGVLVIGAVVKNSFETGNNLGYDVIIGSKGGRLDLLFNTVYHLNRPIGKFPWTYYNEFLPADKRKDHKAGKYSQYVALAIPICLGDMVGAVRHKQSSRVDDNAAAGQPSHSENAKADDLLKGADRVPDELLGKYRVIGTTPAMFNELLHSKFTDGASFAQNDYDGCVVGADIGRRLGVKVGDELFPAHGVEIHNAFRVTGILARTGTPNDRATFINVEGFFMIADHALGAEEDAAEASKTDAGKQAQPAAKKPDENPEEEVLKEPLPEEKRGVTAVLIRTASGSPELEGLGLNAEPLVRSVNNESVAQAIQPTDQIFVLNDTIVRPLQLMLLVLTVLVVIVAGIGILVSIYNSMSDRRHEIAVMRALGARRGTVMCIVLFESILLALGGGVLGWAAGHLLIGAAGPTITDYTGVTVSPLQFSIYELILIPGLIVLASLVGYLPALAAYRTDVCKALTATR